MAAALPKPDDGEIEKALLIPFHRHMTDILDSVGGDDKPYRLVIAGGKGIEYYLSGRLQSEFASNGLYDKSFDFDIIVYEKVAPGAAHSWQYSPFYATAGGYTFDLTKKSPTKFQFVKAGMPALDPKTFQPFSDLVTALKAYYANATPGSQQRRNDYLDSLKLIEHADRIDFRLLNQRLGNGEIFVIQYMRMPFGVYPEHSRKSLWRIKIEIPLLGADPAETVKIELVDLKNTARVVETMGAGNPMPKKYKHNPNNTFTPDPTGTYLKCGNGFVNSYTYWTYRGSTNHNDVSIKAVPTRGGIVKNVYVCKPNILLEDNGRMVGKRANMTAYLGGAEYTGMTAVLKKTFGLPNAVFAGLDLPFILRQDVVADLGDPKYIRKYKKRAIRVYSMAVLYSMLQDNNLAPGGKLINWPENLVSRTMFLELFNYDILSLNGMAMVPSPAGAPLAYIKKDIVESPLYPILYNLFKANLCPGFFIGSTAAPENLNIGFKIKAEGNANEKAANQFAELNKVCIIPYQNEQRVSGIQAGTSLQFKVGAGAEKTITYGNISIKLSNLVSDQGIFKQEFTALSHLYSFLTTVVKTCETRQDFRIHFQKTLENYLKPENCGAGNTVNCIKAAFLKSFISFSFKYPPGAIQDKPIYTYMWSTPISVLTKVGNTNIVSMIENLNQGSSVWLRSLYKTNMTNIFPLDDPFLRSAGVKNVLSNQYTLYKFNLKGKGFFVNHLEASGKKKEIYLLPFTKFKIRSKEYKFIPNLTNMAQEENPYNYIRVYVVELDQDLTDLDDAELELIDGIALVPPEPGWKEKAGKKVKEAANYIGGAAAGYIKQAAGGVKQAGTYVGKQTVRALASKTFNEATVGSILLLFLAFFTYYWGGSVPGYIGVPGLGIWNGWYPFYSPNFAKAGTNWFMQSGPKYALGIGAAGVAHLAAIGLKVHWLKEAEAPPISKIIGVKSLKPFGGGKRTRKYRGLKRSNRGRKTNRISRSRLNKRK